MLQREAMWINFNGSKERAMKVSVGGRHFLYQFLRRKSRKTVTGVSSITGHPRDRAPSSNTTQDYLTLPTQPWLDGICIEPGALRQFVAMPLGHGYTIEEQMTGQAKIGGIQFDVFPSFNSVVGFYSRHPTMGKAGYDMSLSPSQLGIYAGESIEMNVK